MNRIFFIMAIAAAIILSSSCNATTEKATNKETLPIKTSLGDLVKIENKDEVKTVNETILKPEVNKTILPKPEEVIYVLSFEGKTKIEYEGIKSSDPSELLHFPLVDSNGKKFIPVFVGSTAKEGVLSNQGIWYSEKSKWDGKKAVPTGEGEIILPEPKLTLVYIVPKDASGLALKDGGQQHPIN